MPRKILDLSQWQPPEAIDYDVVSQQVDGVILRAGYTGYETGKGATDTAFERHYAALLSAVYRSVRTGYALVTTQRWDFVRAGIV